MSVATIDFDAAFAEFMTARAVERQARLTPPLVRFWDGNWDLRGRVERIITANVVEKNNETGTAVFTLPLDYYISEWIIDFENRTEVIHCTVEKDGVRWSGRMDEFAVVKMEDGSDHLRIAFKHDFEELKKLIVFPNPFLGPEVQFPRLWLAFGPARFVCKLTALLNVMRVEGHFWQLPDDPLDPAQWPIGGPDTWWMVVKPDAIGNDTSPLSLVHARMKSVHEATKSVCEDAQLTWTFRRFLEGDEPPWPGANLRHGCLVIDLEDKGNRFGETSMGGDLFGGLIRQKTTVGNDGMTEGVDIIKDPDFPAEYSDPNWQGTMPRAPWVTYRDGVHTAIATSEFSMKPATAVQIVAGGHSMPFVNEIISQTVQMVGDLTAMIPFTPPLGGVADAVLKPIYSDTLMAFGATKIPGRAARLGRNHFREQFQEGADRAYTLGYLISQRLGAFSTERKIGHELTVVDGAPYKIGQRGLGHFYIGDRVGTTVRGMRIGKIFVDQVTEVGLEWSREKAATWKITLGHREPADPVIQAFKRLQEILGALHDLGML